MQSFTTCLLHLTCCGVDVRRMKVRLAATHFLRVAPTAAPPHTHLGQLKPTQVNAAFLQPACCSSHGDGYLQGIR